MGCAKIRYEPQTPGAAGWIKMAREARGVEQRDLAQKLGISVAGLKKLEHGKRQPTERELERLALVLRFPERFFTRPAPEHPHREGLVCGEGVEPCERCGYAADFLCDFPVGGGETCDLALCERHAVAQGSEWEDLHFSPQHSLIARGLVREQGLREV